MGRKEKLLQKLKAEKVKLEVRKKRFELWENDLAKKDEEGFATHKDIRKEHIFWLKKRRLEDRIEAVDNKIFELEKRWRIFGGAF